MQVTIASSVVTFVPSSARPWIVKPLDVGFDEKLIMRPVPASCPMVQYGVLEKAPAVNVTAHAPDEIFPIVAKADEPFNCEVMTEPASQFRFADSIRIAPVPEFVTPPTRTGVFIEKSIALIDHSITPLVPEADSVRLPAPDFV